MLSQILPEVFQLTFSEKLQLIRIITEDIERPLTTEKIVFEPNKVYYLHTPYNTFGAAEQLMKALQEYRP